MPRMGVPCFRGTSPTGLQSWVTGGHCGCLRLCTPPHRGQVPQYPQALKCAPCLPLTGQAQIHPSMVSCLPCVSQSDLCKMQVCPGPRRGPHLSCPPWPCGLALPSWGPGPPCPEMEPQVLHTWAVPWAPTPWPQPHPRRIRVPRGYGWPLLVSPEAGTLHKGRNRRPAQHPSTARHLDRRAHARLRAGASLSGAGRGARGARLCWVAGWGAREESEDGGPSGADSHTQGASLPGGGERAALPEPRAGATSAGLGVPGVAQGSPGHVWWARDTEGWSQKGALAAEGGSRSMASTWGCPRTVPVLGYLMGPGGGAGAGLGQGALA